MFIDVLAYAPMSEACRTASLDEPAHQFHRALLDRVVTQDHERLGDAILAGQSDYADTGAFPELLSIYHLLGDPAWNLR
jgi:hypothetical protein